MKHRLLVGRIFKVSTYLFICEKRLIIQIFTSYDVQRDSCMKLKNIHASWKFFWLLLEKFRSDGQASKEKGISFKLYGLLIHLIFLAEIHIGRGGWTTPSLLEICWRKSNHGSIQERKSTLNYLRLIYPFPPKMYEN